MRPATFRTIRQGLGLSTEEIAEALGASKRSVENWEAGRVSPRASTLQDLAELQRAAAEEVAHHIEVFTAEAKPVAPVMFIESERAGWQRAIAFRVMQAVPELQVIEEDQIGVSDE